MEKSSPVQAAAAHGFPDGERLPLALAIENARRIVAASDLPVSVDVESGYGESPDAVGRAVAAVVQAGAVGCNLEDSCPSDGGLRTVANQVDRLRQARQAVDAARKGFFINARSDVFFRTPLDRHDVAMVEAIVERGRAYADAGADGLFAPGLVDATLIGRLVAAASLPINVMVGAGTPPLGTLAELGVARVSHGPGPYSLAMQALAEAARLAIRVHA